MTNIKTKQIPKLMLSKGFKPNDMQGSIYKKSSQFLEDLLKQVIEENIGKEAPVNGILPKYNTGASAFGYQNISAILIRFKTRSLNPSMKKEPSKQNLTPRGSKMNVLSAQGSSNALGDPIQS